MKKLFCLLFVVVVCTLASSSIFAQTTAVSDQKFQELINEVRQLRIEVQRLSTSAQRLQLLVERSRSQQESVTRLTQELTGIRQTISVYRDKKSEIKDAVVEAEKRKEKGMISDTQLNALYAEQRTVNQHEQRLSELELQLASELEVERANLNDLKTRLDKLEQELIMPGSEPGKKKE